MKTMIKAKGKRSHRKHRDLEAITMQKLTMFKRKFALRLFRFQVHCESEGYKRWMIGEHDGKVSFYKEKIGTWNKECIEKFAQ